MILADTHVHAVCRPGAGAGCCAFLLVSLHGWECAKGTSLEATLRERIPSMNAQGDNCSGPPDFIPTVPL